MQQMIIQKHLPQGAQRDEHGYVVVDRSKAMDVVHPSGEPITKSTSRPPRRLPSLAGAKVVPDAMLCLGALAGLALAEVVKHAAVESERQRREWATHWWRQSTR
jgi:hypothetical protein